jgi:hypothetical protein
MPADEDAASADWGKAAFKTADGTEKNGERTLAGLAGMFG